MAYANKNNLDQALAYSKEALTIHRKVVGDNHPELAYTYEILGNIYIKRHEYSFALKNFRKALELRSQLQDSNDRNDIANLYSEIGVVYSATKKYGRALDYFNKALLLHNALPEPNRPQRAMTLKGIGDIYVHLREPSISLRYYQQSINALLPEFSDSSIYANPKQSNITCSKELLEILLTKAGALEKYYSLKSHNLGDLQGALKTYECAADILTMLRRKITTEGSKLFLEEQSYALHENAIRVSVTLFNLTKEPRYKGSAFAFAENSKANVLLDGLYDSEAKQFAGIPDSIIEKERALKIDLAKDETQLQKENEKEEKKGSMQITALQDKCFALTNEAQNLSTLLENDYPQYYELKHKHRTATIEEIQRAIDKRTGVVEYCIGKRSITTFVITNSSFDVLTVPTPANFSRLTTTFYRAIKTVNEKNYLGAGSGLYDLLLRPSKKYLAGKNRLLIIPDGILYYSNTYSVEA